MSGIFSSRTWSNEQVTADKLNAIADESVFDDPAADASIEVSGGKLRVGSIDATTNINRASLIDLLYPVGSIYTNANVATNPGTLFGVGTWEAFAEGRAIIGVGQAANVKWSGSGYTDPGTDFAAEDTTGTEDHRLTTGQMPSHSHNYQRPGINGLAGNTPVSGAASAALATISSTSAGGNAAHNNMQPSIAVYLWKRTA